MANLRIAELDFDTIKSNLKTYFESQTEFTDYDFEGSGLSVLLDILAYNTHYNAYLANMLMNEMFIDSAVKRSSVVSLAKHLGYTPRSARGAIATVDITVGSPTGLPTTLTLPAYSQFTSSINGTSYNFVNVGEVVITPLAGVYTFSNVNLVQGQPLSYSYTVGSTPGPSEKFEIPNENVDTTTLRVTVQNSSSDLTTQTYTLVEDVTLLDGTSLKYFLQENALGKYEIFFGDGVLGKKLSTGNIVTIDYVITDGTAANTSSNITQSFTAASTIGGSSDITISVTTNSRGGAAKEGIDSIKFNSLITNSARNRAVTADDYVALLTSTVTEAESISVWGGETNVPPIYGKVIISLKPYSGFIISQETKNYITDLILSSKKVISIQPEFVDPEYFYVNIELNVKYNPNLTTQSASQIETVVRNTINTYFADNLGKFNQDFYTSRLTKSIFDANDSIVSVNPEVRLQKRITPTLITTETYVDDNSIKFYNRLHPSRLTSSYFYTTVEGASTLVYFIDVPDAVVLDYNGTGTIKLYNATTAALINPTYGTINYATGEVVIPELVATGYPTGVNDIRVTCELQEASYDVTADRNQILVLDESVSIPTYGITKGVTINTTQVVE